MDEAIILRSMGPPGGGPYHRGEGGVEAPAQLVSWRSLSAACHSFSSKPRVAPLPFLGASFFLLPRPAMGWGGTVQPPAAGGQGKGMENRHWGASATQRGAALPRSRKRADPPFSLTGALGSP